MTLYSCFPISIATTSVILSLIVPVNICAQEKSSQEKIDEVKSYVKQYCGACHQVPSPNVIPKKDWPRVIKTMADLATERTGSEIIPQDRLRDITAFYYGSSPEKLPTLPYNNTVHNPLHFEVSAIGNKTKFPLIANIQAANLDKYKNIELLVSDGEKNQLLLLTKTGEAWKEKVLADIPVPVNTQVVDYDLDGDKDILVAALGYYPPSDVLAGKVILLEQNNRGEFIKKTLLENVGRVVDAQAVDIDKDGDLDVTVAVFGGGQVGEVAWLENIGSGKHIKHDILKMPGALNASPIDLNGDGHIDIVSLITQEHEMFVALLNDGKGKFKQIKLAQAPHPMYGSTSMSLIDMDKDGDKDILFTNGDNFDLQRDPKPYHGVQWLENKGNLQFTFHEIGRFYGAVKAKGADIDRDGDIDVVASSWSNFWDDEKRQSLIWYENTGQQKFIRHDITNRPISIVPIELIDLDKDNRLDIIAGIFRVTALNDMLMDRAEKHSQMPESRIIELKISSSQNNLLMQPKN